MVRKKTNANRYENADAVVVHTASGRRGPPREPDGERNLPRARPQTSGNSVRVRVWLRFGFGGAHGVAPVLEAWAWLSCKARRYETIAQRS